MTSYKTGFLFEMITYRLYCIWMAVEVCMHVQSVAQQMVVYGARIASDCISCAEIVHCAHICIFYSIGWSGGMELPSKIPHYLIKGSCCMLGIMGPHVKQPMERVGHGWTYLMEIMMVHLYMILTLLRISTAIMMCLS